MMSDSFIIQTARIRGFCGVLIGSALMAACTHGPPYVEARIENVRAKPGAHLFAVSVKVQQLRAPTGINRFPNGGVSKVLDEKAELYVYNLDTHDVKCVASLSPPDSMNTSWQPWILGWVNDTLFVKLTGQAGTTAKDFQTLNTVVYQIDADGDVSEGVDLPKNLLFQNNTGPMPHGIFVRVKKGHQAIEVKTEAIEDWQRRVEIDDQRGELRAVTGPF